MVSDGSSEHEPYQDVPQATIKEEEKYELSSIGQEDADFFSRKDSPNIKELKHFVDLKREKGYDISDNFYLGSLRILMPGDKLNFVDRYFTLTPRSFQYYSKKRNFEQGKAPLYSIWLKDIKEVRLTEPEKKKKSSI